VTKQEFLSELRACLARLPAKDAEEHLDYYCEMIDDRIEEGLPEEDAVAAVGFVSDVAAQILAEEPIEDEAIKLRKPRRKMRGWEITLLILGSPIWLSLLVAVFAVLLSLIVSAWAVVISLWSVFGALIGGAVGGVIGGIGFMVTGHGAAGIGMLAAGLVTAGLSIFAFFGCCAVTKGLALATKKTIVGIKKCFIKREERYE
jgi:uncharacterized membrane protein